MEQKKVSIVRKSAMQASGEYDYQKLIYHRSGFINCEIQEEKEELYFTFDVSNLKPFHQIRKEKTTVRLAILMDAINLYHHGEHVQFIIDPDNLYYDLNNRVYVMHRDVYARGSSFNQEEFICQYKALLGYCMQGKYSFEDYSKGGEALLKKHSFLKQFFAVTDLEQFNSFLEQEYERLIKEQETKKVLVSKAWYQKSSSCLIFLLVGLLITGAYLGYQMYYINPYQVAVINAGNAFLDYNYVKTIDELKLIPNKRLKIEQKYILAVAYVKSENLSEEQSKNILAGLSLSSSEKMLEYWIYIGRLNVAEAQNIAIQISDDQLLLYAYLKEKLLVETNTELSGEDKIKALSAVEAKIGPLAEKFNTEE